MMFVAPLALLGLLGLPAIFFLLRFNPPPARRVVFPPLALLRDLPIQERTPRRIPLWLLVLRLLAAALIVVGLAGPTLHPPGILSGTGPLLLVIDNGWAAAADWPDRRATASRLIAAAGRDGRGVAILATAGTSSAAPPRIGDVMTADNAMQRIDALQPEPWPSGRAALAEALEAAPETTRIYLADGITDGAGFTTFFHALAPTVILAGAPAPLLVSARLAADRSLVMQTADTRPGDFVLARTASGAVLARAALSPTGGATVALPPALFKQLTALTLGGPATASGTLLLDGSSRTVITGLAAGDGNAEAPFLGGLYFIRRALPANAAPASGDLAALVAAKADMIVLADVPLNAAQSAMARRFIANGGVLVRFAGPLTAAAPDDLSPDPLLGGERHLGGALTWSTLQGLAPFPAASPFFGLPGDASAAISRQILADPTTLLAATVWASLQDGTPLVLGAAIGRGYLVSVLTSANTEWSNLALSGLFPAMLGRLASLAAGAAPQPGLLLSLSAQLTAFGALTPPTTATSLTAGDLTGAPVSPEHPPGLYGNGATTLAFNLGGHVPAPVAAALPNAAPLGNGPPSANLGAWLIAVALLLLAVDLLLSLYRRGLLGLRRLAFLAFLAALLVPPAPAQAQSGALQTTLGYIRTGDPTTDQISADGLGYISADVSAHTAAALDNPVALDPATDDLGLYPLIYWPILPTLPAPGPVACNALKSYMRHGGLLIIDSKGSDAGAAGSGAGFSPGAGAALDRATACLSLPPLQPLGPADVLAHCFYILQDFPGRFVGAPTLIAAPASRDADGVSPVVIGQNDWAGAWARDAIGLPEQLPIPGGEDQRVLADRFGTNLVIYALTGSYKSDQNSVPALLDKLGQ